MPKISFDPASTLNGQATPRKALTPQEVDDAVTKVTADMMVEVTAGLGNSGAACRAVQRGLELFLYNIEDSRFFSTASVERRLRHLIRKAAGLEPKKRPRRNKRRAGDESKTEHSIGDGTFTSEELTAQIAHPQNLKRFKQRARKFLGSANDAEAEDITATALLIATERVKSRDVSFTNLPQYCAWFNEVIRRQALARRRSVKIELAEILANRNAEGVEIDFGAIDGRDCEFEIVRRTEHIQSRQLVREELEQLPVAYQKSLQDEVRRSELDDKPPLSCTLRSALFRARHAAKERFATCNIKGAAFIPANDNCWPIDDDDER